MTEIPDLSQLFGPPPQLSDEQKAATEAIHQRKHREELRAYGQVQFFGAILCNCQRRYDREDKGAPQVGCIVHGHLQFSHDGELLMFGMPKRW